MEWFEGQQFQWGQDQSRRGVASTNDLVDWILLHCVSADLHPEKKVFPFSTLYALLSTLCFPLSAFCFLLSTVCCLLSALCSLLSALCSLLSALCSLVLLSTVYFLLSALCSLRSALCSLLSALCSLALFLPLVYQAVLLFKTVGHSTTAIPNPFKYQEGADIPIVPLPTFPKKGTIDTIYVQFHIAGFARDPAPVGFGICTNTLCPPSVQLFTLAPLLL
jgi:hypothetical protein